MSAVREVWGGEEAFEALEAYGVRVKEAVAGLVQCEEWKSAKGVEKVQLLPVEL